MTDKQIMIDGVKVLKEKINMCFILLLNKLETPETIEQTIYEHLDAFVKEWNTQLARKTQECEDLKERLERTEEDLKYQCVDCMNVKYDRYRKALEEIEDICKNGVYDEFGMPLDECGFILDIINKAKGEGICQ